MPPRRKQKSSEEKKEAAERQKRIETTKEKILSIKRKILSIVEVMLERDISKEWFLANCTQLCHADYDDVIQERSIDHICGYPLCSNTIKQTLKQKYHISRLTNKVYDLTERKCFCSNQCYKASNYLRAQLSPIPLYMRKEEVMKIKLLSDCDNKGSIGEEIVFHHTISPNEIEQVYNKEDTSNHFKNMLDEEVKNCVDSLGDLQIKEHVFDKQYVFSEQTANVLENSSLDHKDESHSDIDSADSDDSSLDERLFSNCDNVSVLSEKHMPVPKKINKAVLIPPLKPSTAAPVQQPPLDFIIDAFKDWMTEDSMKFLFGEKYVYGAKAEHLFQRMTSTEPLAPEKLSSIKNEYIKLCLKIDSLPDDSDVSDSFDLDMGSDLSSCTSRQTDTRNNSEKKVFKRRPKKKSNSGEKHVTFSQEPQTCSESNAKKKGEAITEGKVETPEGGKLETKSEHRNEGGKLETKSEHRNETRTDKSVLKEEVERTDGKTTSALPEDVKVESPVESTQPEPLFPLVDSVSQNSLRKQLVMSKLKSVYTELLPIVGLHYTDIREEVRKFVDTLSLTPTNVIFKPKEWKLISVVLLKVLTKTVLEDLIDELKLIKLYEDPVMPIAIDAIELEKVVSHIISIKNILNIH